MEPVTKRQKIDPQVMSFKLDFLPAEIIIKILLSVNIKDIVHCMCVNKRIRAIAQDNTLWEAIHLRSKESVPAKLLKVIVENGCKYFSFPFGLGIKGTVKFNQNSQLKYLYFPYGSNSDDVLLDLAASCVGLEKLAINGLIDINPNGFAKILKCIIQNSSTLKVLSIICCKIPDKVLELIVTLCGELQGISY